jgi:hypothetical protein
MEFCFKFYLMKKPIFCRKKYLIFALCFSFSREKNYKSLENQSNNAYNMRKLNVFLFLLFAFSAWSQKKEENLYALNIGNFATPELADFAALQKYGLVYAIPFKNDQAQVFVGDFSDKNTATIALNNIKKAFPEAYVATKRTTLNTLSTVQLMSKKVGEKINWKSFENAGSIFAASDGKFIQIVSAGFANDSLASIGLSDLKSLGYKNAILKKISEVKLHKVSIFESGLALDSPIKKKTPPAPPKPPTPPVIDYYTGNYPITQFKRGLSALGTYKGKIDENIDPALQKAYDEAKKSDKTLAKYVILANAYTSQIGKPSELQAAINNIEKDAAGSAKILEKSTQPIAKAYRAYILFTQNGDEKTVNSLMNDALKTSFKGMKENKFAFDAAANYNYKELSQLIKHIRFIQGVAKDEPAAPIWLFTEHPAETKAAFTGDFKIEGSDPALQIESARLTKLMADDLVATSKKDIALEQKNTQERTKMLILPSLVTEKQDGWNIDFWDGIETWATKDAVNQATVKSFKVAYYQALIDIQNQYAKQMGLKISDPNTRNAALLIMKSIIEKPLAQYGRQKTISK